jgi:hypothetical protein
MQQLHGFTIGLTLGALGASALFLAPSAQGGRGQSPEGQPPASQGPDEQMMARMAELAAPGEPHQLLAQGAGEWNLSHKMRLSADLPWMEAQGRMQAKMLLGGRWLQQEIDIDMGQMQGFQLIGYDNLAREYVAF